MVLESKQRNDSRRIKQTRELVMDKKETSIRAFINDCSDILVELKPIEKDILFMIMCQIDSHNIIRLTSTVRKAMQAALGLSQGSVSKGIIALIDKNILLKIQQEHADKFNLLLWSGKEYLISPKLIGNRFFGELSNIKRFIEITFDFKTNEIVKDVSSTFIYQDGTEETNQMQGRVCIYDDEDKGKSNSEDKEKVKSAVSEVTSQSCKIELENEQLKLKIKALELENVKLDKENIKLEKEIELAKLRKAGGENK